MVETAAQESIDSPTLAIPVWSARQDSYTGDKLFIQISQVA